MPSPTLELFGGSGEDVECGKEEAKLLVQLSAKPSRRSDWMSVDRKIWKEAAQALGFRALGVCSGASAEPGWGGGAGENGGGTPGL